MNRFGTLTTTVYEIIRSGNGEPPQVAAVRTTKQAAERYAAHWRKTCPEYTWFVSETKYSS